MVVVKYCHVKLSRREGISRLWRGASPPSSGDEAEEPFSGDAMVVSAALEVPTSDVKGL